MLFALFFLGLVQGLTEFLPVSSSGHLTLLSNLFGITESLPLSILLHVATLFSVFVVFRKEIFHMIRHPFSKETIHLALATILTCAIVLLLMPIIKESFSGKWLALSFFVSAILLFVSEMISNQKKSRPIDTKISCIMGLAQGLAVFPGISRSGTTLSAGLLSGGRKEEVSKFSFIMSVPIILASLIMEIFELKSGVSTFTLPIGGLVLSFLTAFLVGIFSIKFMLKILKKSNLKWFAIYLIIISIISLIVL